MLFNSYIFIFLFLPLSVFGYFFLNKIENKAAMVFLLLMSLWFYGYFNYKYLYIIICSIIVNYCFSRILILNWGALHRRILSYAHKNIRWALLADGGGGKKAILAVAVLFNIGFIFYFKYYNFFAETINQLYPINFNVRNVILPLGISFFTFQQIAYVIDSYYGKTNSYTFLEYALYVSFFPQLVAGPIVLHAELIPQFQDKFNKKINYDALSKGIMWFTLGLFKKVIIADTLGAAVSWAYGNPGIATSMDLWIASVSYTFQIYFDFSGYSDMACGIAYMFNLKLPMNFNSPYKAESIVDFWKRWHITLTRFLKDYIYIPLGGSQKGTLKTYINVFIVFLISGIWHGANWTFIFWGILHGCANILNRIFSDTYAKLHSVTKWCITFLFVNFTWVIFRADSIGHALYIIKKMLSMSNLSVSTNLYEAFVLPENHLIYKISGLGYLNSKITGFSMWTALLLCFLLCLNLENNYNRAFKINIITLAGVILLLGWGIVSLSSVSEFLYFNF